jgi:hypothetical protein
MLSAPENSNLAVILSGFLIAAITIVLTIQSESLRTRHIAHSLAFFAAGLAVLGLDSYLFSTIAGTNTELYLDKQGSIVDSAGLARLCRTVWDQGLYASALLAVGGTALACGVGWLLVNYAAGAAPSGRTSTNGQLFQAVRFIVWFAPQLTLALIATSTGLLYRTVIYYLKMVSGGKLATCEWVVILLIAVGVFLFCAVTIEMRTKYYYRDFRDNAGEDEHLNIGMLRIATTLILLMAIFGPLLAALSSLWTFRPFAVLVLSGVPMLVAFCSIALSVPGGTRPPKSEQSRSFELSVPKWLSRLVVMGLIMARLKPKV